MAPLCRGRAEVHVVLGCDQVLMPHHNLNRLRRAPRMARCEQNVPQNCAPGRTPPDGLRGATRVWTISGVPGSPVDCSCRFGHHRLPPCGIGFGPAVEPSALVKQHGQRRAGR